jgi:hypothetical protein
MKVGTNAPLWSMGTVFICLMFNMLQFLLYWCRRLESVNIITVRLSLYQKSNKNIEVKI